MPAARHRPRLGAVVVTFNRLAQIRVTVDRLLDSPIDHLLVVDNGSTDGSRDWLAQRNDPRLELICTERNLGGAGGFALGVDQMTRRHDPDWLLLGDDDSRPEPGMIERFLHSDHGDWDAVAGAAYYPDGAICGMNRPVLNPFMHLDIFFKTLVGGRRAFHLKDADYAQPDAVPVDGASFVGFFLSRRAVQLAGLPDARMFIYAEDGLYSLGLSRAGGRIVFLPWLRFEHDCSSFSAAAGRLTPLWKVYYYHRNLLLLYRAAAGWMFWPGLLMILPKWLMKLTRYGGERRIFLHLIGLALWDGLRRDLRRPLAEIQAIASPRG